MIQDQVIMTPHDQSFTVSITVDDGNAAIEYYQMAFNAELLMKMPMPDGSLGHADLKIGNTLFYVSGEYPDWNAFSPKTLGGAPNLLCIRDDAFETLFQQAVDLGAKVMHPMQNFPWGVRAGVITDPFGYRWSIGKVVEDLTAEQIQLRLMSMESGE